MKWLGIFIVFILCSCTTLKTIEREREIVRRDTVEVRTDTIERIVTVPGETKTLYLERIDTRWINRIIPDIRVGKFSLDTLRICSTHAEAWFGVKNNRPFFGITQRPIDLMVESYERQVTILEQQLKEKERQVVKRYRFYENPWFWAWGITTGIVVGLGYAGFKRRR